jgi:hypothetical protein
VLFPAEEVKETAEFRAMIDVHGPAEFRVEVSAVAARFSVRVSREGDYIDRALAAYAEHLGMNGAA